MADIERLLALDPVVERAVVVQHGVTAEGRLMVMVYVVLRPRVPSPPELLTADRSAERGRRYSGTDPESVGTDFDGLVADDRGCPLSRPVREKWRSASIDAVLRHRPDRVLEIGAGSGILLPRLSRHCAELWATDHSAEAVGLLRRWRASVGSVGNLHLYHQPAGEVGRLPRLYFDVVLLNSVAQDFPSADHLAATLDAATELLAPGGVIVLSDVRNLALYRSLRTAVHLFRGNGPRRLAELATRVGQDEALEQELLLAPDFFCHWAENSRRIGGVDIAVRRDLAPSRYRYQVRLYDVAARTVDVAGLRRVGWAGKARLAADLARSAGGGVRVTGIPDVRLSADSFREVSGPDGRRMAELAPDRGRCQAPTISALNALGRTTGHRVSVSPAPAADGSLDASFFGAAECSDPSFGPDWPVGTYRPAKDSVPRANDPALGHATAALLAELTGRIDALGPAVTGAITIVDRLPPDCELDVQALPPPDRVAAGRYRSGPVVRP
ncbi:class I SAM-dependent methyltransferase [Kribbella sp. NPDC056861]|uniref:class I SAM-dependent methyltransferase n=1 Tax=Kribbella sp. NPDC056861 TaxID=3154857 RepID=UPI00343515B2